MQAVGMDDDQSAHSRHDFWQRFTTEGCALIADLFYVLLAVVKGGGIVSVVKESSGSWPTHTVDLLLWTG